MTPNTAADAPARLPLRKNTSWKATPPSPHRMKKPANFRAALLRVVRDSLDSDVAHWCSTRGPNKDSTYALSSSGVSPACTNMYVIGVHQRVENVAVSKPSQARMSVYPTAVCASI